MRRLTQEQFLEKAKKQHPEFDYSISIYKNRRTKIKFVCDKHGLQECYPDRIHCKYCGKLSYREKRKLSLETIISQFKKTHNNKFNYSLVNYINIDTPVRIICNTCNKVFLQSPYEHRNGSGCPYCYGRYKTTEDFIKAAKLVHGDKYDYSLTNYVNCFGKVKIICKKHGIFEQTYGDHVLIGTNCPACAKNKSKGEEKLKELFDKYNIKYNWHYSFEDCKYKKILEFDFYLPDKNILVEYDGIQHFQPVGFGGNAEVNYSENVIRDGIKNEYCKKKNIKLIRIPYTDYDILEEIVCKRM